MLPAHPIESLFAAVDVATRPLHVTVRNIYDKTGISASERNPIRELVVGESMWQN
jgi:hypothetical protein